MARFGQFSLVPPLMDEIFVSSNMSLVPTLDELIKMVQYHGIEGRRRQMQQKRWMVVQFQCYY